MKTLNRNLTDDQLRDLENKILGLKIVELPEKIKSQLLQSPE